MNTFERKGKNMLFFVTCPILDTSLNLGSTLSPDNQDAPGLVSYATLCCMYDAFHWPELTLTINRDKRTRKKFLNQLSFLPR